MGHFVQVAANGSGEYVDTFQVNDGSVNVDRQAVVFADSTNYAARAAVQNSDPAATDYGLTVRMIRMPCLTYSVISDASDNAAFIKAAAGVVYGFEIYNNATYQIFVKLYNKATAPAPATDSALLVRRIGVQQGITERFFIDRGLSGFTSGIGIAIVQNIGDTDDTAVLAGDCVVNIDYL